VRGTGPAGRIPAILQRLTIVGAESLYPPYFCDKSQKPGKIVRA